MTAKTIVTTSLVSGLISCAIAGAAMADNGTTTTIGGTYNDGSTTVSVNNETSRTVTNNSSVTVTNQTSQTVSSGGASVTDVSKGGNVTTGSATATSTTTTTINQSGSGGGSNTPGMGGGSGGGSGSGGSGGGTTADGSLGMGGGSGSGSGTEATLSAATLPDTGASVPVDVSALRALYHDPTLTGTAVANTAGLFSGTLLGGAALLSLLGAGGTTLYNRRRLKV